MTEDVKIGKDTKVFVNGEEIDIKEAVTFKEVGAFGDFRFSKSTENLRAQWEEIKTEDLNIDGDVFIEWAYQIAEKIQNLKYFHKRNIFKQICDSNLSDKQKRVLDKFTQKAFNIGWQEGED